MNTGTNKRILIGGFAVLAIPFLLAAEPAWNEGEHGLWRLQLANGSYLSAADVATNGVHGTCAVARDGAATRRTWRTDRADVTVVETPTGDGAVDLRAEVTPHGADAKMLELPANVRFKPETVRSFVYPGRGNSGIGMAFNAKFFQPSPEDKPTAWHAGPHTYDKGYRHLYGASPINHPVGMEPTNLIVTAEGARWLGTDAATIFSRCSRVVMRPPAKGQSDLVLIDSPAGPYLSGKHFGGAGMLWRFGVAGSKHDRYEPSWEAIAVRRILPRLAAKASGRTRVAVIALRCGPKSGAFVPLAVSDWTRELKRSLPRGCTFETLADVAEMKRALAAPDTLLVVNPYGEHFPCGRAEDYIPCLDAVREFVRAGGNWVEAGGFSFFRPLVGGGYFSIRTPYPPLFADFAHLTTTDGRTVACYGIQPRAPHEPWQNPVHFVPGETGTGGDAGGGWFFHAFACWAKDGQTAKTPAVRIRTGAGLEKALEDYARANTLARPISDKVKDPAKVDLFRRAPLFFIAGTAQEKIASLEVMPVPSLIHYSDYLKGGFDKEYPDHLPPRPEFGTGAELRAFHDRAHAKGHLVSPYTNPTWWCDHPRGPSFIAAGEAPLSLGFDGKPYHEQYSKNDGWTITFWHPAVQAANRKTVKEFTVDYPVDLLFQDQCGARQWRWDFNPASPSPTAYTEGILAMNEEDSRIVPLGTEDGWDQVANQQAAICGCTWRTVPVPRPPWRDLFKDVYPADSWHIEPVATRLFHDKAFFYMHDLGSFVTNERTLAWMFAIGYQLSWRASARNYVTDKAAQAWYEWLQLLQDKVVSRIALQPVVAFAHDRAPLLALPGDPSREEDDGVVTATYGDVSVAVNLGDVARTVAGKRLAAYGWWITAPGLVAAKLEGEMPYVETDGHRWEYRPAPSRPTVPCPPEVAGKPLHETTSRDARLAVIDLEGAHGSWVKASANDWKTALAASPLATRYGMQVVLLRSAAAVRAALAAGRTAYFAIVNPYGETFPTEGPGRWKETIDAIHDYVAHGGIWVETGSASFYGAIWKDGTGWRREHLGPKGLDRLGSAILTTDIDEPAVALRAAADWFPPQTLKRIAATRSQVNRAPCNGKDETVFSLVADGEGRAWFGCHRLGGWGTLWRLGGSNPDRELALEVVPAALLYQYEHAPLPIPPAPYRKATLQAGHATKMRLGCQMWSVKEFWEKNPEKGFAEVFPKLRAMGYEGVQSMAFWKIDPERLEALLKANDLALADMPVNFEHVEGTNIESTVAFCRRFGVDFVYIPWFKGKTADEWRTFCRRLAAAGKRLVPYGIKIGYHNHVHEFTEPLDGELPANILKADASVNLELDVGPVAESGNNAPSWIAALSGRVPGLHAKPHGASAAGAPGDVQDWPKVVAAARKAGVKWFVVECEKRKGTYDDIAASAAYFKPLLDRDGYGASPAPAARMDRTKLLIGAYGLQDNAKTEAHVKAIRDCGVDFIACLPANDRATLDLFAKHGVGALVKGVVPGWWGGNGERAGKMREVNPPEKYAVGAAAFKDHPAIWAVDIGDEPSALDFPYYGEVVRQLRRALPGMPLYLNLYPNYASTAQNTGKQAVNQLGTKTYAEHVQAYCREVPLDYISYDFYPYMKAQAGTDRFLSKMYDNFLVVADACRRTKKSFWYVPQVNSRAGLSPTSENRIRFQANAALSFGAEAITWACWCKGWWTNNVIDAAGRQTEQYEKLRRVNAELKRLGPRYMRFRNVATRFVGFAADCPWKPSMTFAGAPDDPGYVRASNGAALLVGEMVARDPASKARAYFVTAADDPCDTHPTTFDLVFSFKEKDVTAFGGQGPIPVTRRANGFCAVPISSCGGVLIVAR